MYSYYILYLYLFSIQLPKNIELIGIFCKNMLLNGILLQILPSYFFN